MIAAGALVFGPNGRGEAIPLGSWPQSQTVVPVPSYAIYSKIRQFDFMDRIAASKRGGNVVVFRKNMRRMPS